MKKIPENIQINTCCKSTVVFATKQDVQFLQENTDLTNELHNRKLKYREILIARVDEKPVGLLIFEYLWSHIHL